MTRANRSARPRRPGALRARPAIRTTLWTRLRGGGAGRPHRTGRVRAVLGDHEARRHPGDREAAAALLERAGHHARAPRRCADPAVGDGRHARSAAARPGAPGRERGASRRAPCARGAPTIERIAVEILDAAAPAGASGEFDFVERIAAPFPLAVIAWVLGVPRDDWAAAVPVDQRGDRQGRSGVPPARRDARPDRQAGAGRGARLLPEPDRAAPARAPATIW